MAVGAPNWTASLAAVATPRTKSHAKGRTSGSAACKGTLGTMGNQGAPCLAWFPPRRPRLFAVNHPNKPLQGHARRRPLRDRKTGTSGRPFRKEAGRDGRRATYENPRRETHQSARWNVIAAVRLMTQDRPTDSKSSFASSAKRIRDPICALLPSCRHEQTSL